MQQNIHDYKLDFKPDFSLCKTATIAGERIDIEIVTQFKHDRSWALFINDVIEGCSDNHDQYIDLMLSSIIEIDTTANVLIIGGGDLRLAEAVNHNVPDITVTDPLLIIIQRMLGMIEQQINLTQFRSLTINEQMFSQFVVDESNTYDHVFVDVSENTMEATKEIYCQQFFVDLLKLVKSGSCVHMYFGFDPTDLIQHAIDVGFSHIHTEQRYIQAYCDNSYCVTLQKR